MISCSGVEYGREIVKVENFILLPLFLQYISRRWEAFRVKCRNNENSVFPLSSSSSLACWSFHNFLRYRIACCSTRWGDDDGIQRQKVDQFIKKSAMLWKMMTKWILSYENWKVILIGEAFWQIQFSSYSLQTSEIKCKLQNSETIKLLKCCTFK